MDGKITELISESGHYDTRKVLNRSEKEIPQTVLDEIEADGISSERLETLGVPVFKYKTQVTVHGHFPAVDGGYIGGYKHLIRNDNESVGVRYGAIDYAKKNRIYTALGEVGWSVHRNSSEWTAWKMSKVGLSKEELLAVLEEYKAEKERIDTSLFFGNVSVALYNNPWFGIFAAIQIEIAACYEKNVAAVIENICGKTESEIEQIVADRKAKEEAERIEWRKNYDVELAEEAERKERLLEEIKPQLTAAGLEYHAVLPLKEQRYLKAIFEFGRIVFRVREVFKHGKTLRGVARDFNELAEAVEFLKNGELQHRGSKEIKSCGGWILPTAEKPTTSQVAVAEFTIRRNLEKGGIELIFPEKPNTSVLEKLKQNGWRWSGGQGLWWIRYSESAMKFAEELK